MVARWYFREFRRWIHCFSLDLVARDMYQISKKRAKLTREYNDINWQNEKKKTVSLFSVFYEWRFRIFRHLELNLAPLKLFKRGIKIINIFESRSKVEKGVRNCTIRCLQRKKKSQEKHRTSQQWYWCIKIHR